MPKAPALYVSALYIVEPLTSTIPRMAKFISMRLKFRVIPV